jgi:hypothetical protein
MGPATQLPMPQFQPEVHPLNLRRLLIAAYHNPGERSRSANARIEFGAAPFY